MLDTVKLRSLIKAKYGNIFNFCVEVKVNPTQLSRYLSVRKPQTPKYENLQRIATALGVSVPDLMVQKNTQAH